ncbi:MAG: YdcF family protein [Thermaurantiacus sp.]
MFAALVLAWALGLIWFVASLPGPAPAGLRTDGVAVLTGGPGRIVRGAAVVAAGAANRMLISGVDRSVQPHELGAQAGLPRAMLDCCVDLGFAADNTRANAAEVAEWVARQDMRSVRLVTADHHLRRAMGEVRAALPRSVILHGDAVRDPRPLSYLVLEYNKLLASRAILVARRIRPAT